MVTARQLPETSVASEAAPSAPSAPSAPPESDNPPSYPVLSQPGSNQPVIQQYQPQQPQQAIYGQPQQQQYGNSQQPQQQIIYQQPPDESKQLDTEINTAFNSVIQILNNKKASILTECSSINTNIGQKKDILQQLQHIINGINEVKINPNIQPIQQQQSVIVVQQQPMVQQNIKYISDTWNTSIAHPKLVFNQNTHSVYRNGKRGEWVNCFGNQVISKGQYKKWEIKILPKFKPKKQKDHIADVVIGVVDSKKVSNRAGGFWLGPLLGYGYYGYNGKKFHTNKKGKAYSNKFNINDTLSIEVNMQDFILNFYVNGQFKGKAYHIDARLSYVLAVALSTPDYEVQIC